MFDGPWKKEDIPNEHNVLRQVHFSQLVKLKGRRFPNETHFTPDPDGLSVNWEEYCNEDFALVLIGLTYKFGTQNFKKPPDYKVFKLNAGLLRTFDGIEDVVHDPIFNKKPIVGFPNNRSHSLVKYPNDEELRLKLSDWVGDKYTEMVCKTSEIAIIESEIAKLKERIEHLSQ